MFCALGPHLVSACFPNGVPGVIAAKTMLEPLPAATPPEIGSLAGRILNQYLTVLLEKLSVVRCCVVRPYQSPYFSARPVERT